MSTKNVRSWCKLLKLHALPRARSCRRSSRSHRPSAAPASCSCTRSCRGCERHLRPRGIAFNTCPHGLFISSHTNTPNVAPASIRPSTPTIAMTREGTPTTRRPWRADSQAVTDVLEAPAKSRRPSVPPHPWPTSRTGGPPCHSDRHDRQIVGRRCNVGTPMMTPRIRAQPMPKEHSPTTSDHRRCHRQPIGARRHETPPDESRQAGVTRRARSWRIA